MRLDADGLDLVTVTFARRICGVVFCNTRLEGASINAAKISEACFPAELTAGNIELSLLHGIRMRYRSEKYSILVPFPRHKGMLSKFASIRRLLFGVSDLSRLSGFLVERN